MKVLNYEMANAIFRYDPDNGIMSAQNKYGYHINHGVKK